MNVKIIYWGCIYVLVDDVPGWLAWIGLQCRQTGWLAGWQVGR